MTCSPATWLAAAKKLVSSCSLLLALACAAWSAVDYGRLHRQLVEAKDLKARQRILREFRARGEGDPDLLSKIDELIRAWDSGSPWSPDPAIDMIEMRAVTQDVRNRKSNGQAARQAAEIKQDPFYRDPGLQESSNWFDRAMRRFGETMQRMFDALFRWRMPNMPQSNLNPPDLRWLVYVVWGLLGAIVAAFLYFAFRHFRWRAALRRKATAILEEDEPERTVDEWLERADALAAEGRHREAVRCLYLACLLRFDEAGVARFIRSQTNWEHLARIERSPQLPAGLEFRPATQAFDRIWYGFRVRGAADVDDFRGWYLAITEALARSRAA